MYVQIQIDTYELVFTPGLFNTPVKQLHLIHFSSVLVYPHCSVAYINTTAHDTHSYTSCSFSHLASAVNLLVLMAFLKMCTVN